MANFNWHIQSYRKGRATSQSNYIWRQGQFSTRDDLVATGCGNLPAWSRDDPTLFFAAADAHERRNGAACRHLVLSLPRELDAPAWTDLVEALIAKDIGPKPFQYAIHNTQAGSEEHPHVHILYSDRVPDRVERSADTFFKRANPKASELGGCRKDSGGQSPKRLRIAVVERKKLWAELQNDALAKAGSSARVDHQTKRRRTD